MRFLADESCDASVVRVLRAAGHDVLTVAEIARGAADQTVLELAISDRRVLLTEDKDFGELVFIRRLAAGVLLIRYPAGARSQLPRAVLDLVNDQRDTLTDAFVSLTPAGARLSRV